MSEVPKRVILTPYVFLCVSSLRVKCYRIIGGAFRLVVSRLLFQRCYISNYPQAWIRREVSRATIFIRNSGAEWDEFPDERLASFALSRDYVVRTGVPYEITSETVVTDYLVCAIAISRVCTRMAVWSKEAARRIPTRSLSRRKERESGIYGMKTYIVFLYLTPWIYFQSILKVKMFNIWL